VSLDLIPIITKLLVQNVKNNGTARLVQPGIDVLMAQPMILRENTLLASVTHVQQEAIVQKDQNFFARLVNIASSVGVSVNHAPLAFPVKME
jgi:hypothetical protein